MEHAVERPAAEGTVDSQTPRYDAFISYSHADSDVAGDLQLALHRLGRRFGRRFAVRVFRDTTDLAANPDLWGRVVAGLHASSWLVVVLSSKAASSSWVNRELTEWLALRGPARLLIAVADGVISWDKHSGRLDPVRSTVAPPALTSMGSLPTEPTYVTLAGLDRDLGSPPYRQAILMLSAAVQGRVPADIDSEDLREHRRAQRLRTWAIGALAILATLAIIGATTAIIQTVEASRQRDEARALALAAASEREVGRNSALALALAYEAAVITPIAPTEAIGALVNSRVAFSQPGQAVGRGIALDGGQVTGLAFSKQTGQLWASTARQVRAVDIQGGLAGNVYRGPEYSYAITATGDGTLVAAAGTGTGNGVYVWRASDSALVTSMLRGTNVWDVAFSPDGSLLAAADNDGWLTVWETTGWATISKTRVGMSLSALAFNGAGNEMAVGNSDNSIERFSIPGFARLGSLMEAPGCGDSCGINQLMYSPDDRTLISASQDSKVYKWDARSSQRDGEPLTGHTSAVEGLSVNHDGTLLVTTSTDGYFLLWNVARSTIVGRSAKPIVSNPTAVAFAPNGRTFVVGMSDGSVGVFDGLSGQPIHEEVPSMDRSSGALLATSQDGARIARGDSPITCWDRAKGSDVGPGITSPTTPSVAVFSRDSRQLLVGEESGDVRSWDIDTGRVLAVRIGEGSRTRGLALSPDGRTLAASHDDGTVQMLNADSLSLQTTIQSHHGWVTSLGFAQQGDLLATAGDGVIKLWNTRTGKASGQLPGSVSTFSTNASRLVSNDGNGGVSVWDFPSRNRVLFLESSRAGVGRLEINDDASIWATVFRDELTLWDGRNGRQIGESVKGSGGESRVLFLPESGGFISSDDENLVTIWKPLWLPDGACEAVNAYVTKTQVTQVFSDEWAPSCTYQR